MRIEDTGGLGDPDTPDAQDQDITRLLREGSTIGGTVDVDGAWATGRRRRTRRRAVTGVVAAAAACAVLGIGYAAVSGSLPGFGEDPVAPAASDTEEPPSAEPSVQEPQVVVDSSNAGVLSPEEVVDVAGSSGASGAVGALRFGRHEGFDRAVIELEDVVGRPGYRVGYAEPGTELPGGVSDVPADQVLLIELDVDPGDTTISPGHQDVIGGLGLVRGAEVVGNEDGTLTLALGLQERYSYQVTYLDEPNRLAVDVIQVPPGS